MHWTAVILAAYAAGLVEFWRLCRAAPLMADDTPVPYPSRWSQPSIHVIAQPRIPIQPTTTSSTTARIAVEPWRANRR